MILQMEILEVIAQILESIMIVLIPIVKPIGEFMVSWITVVIAFLQQNLGGELAIFIMITVILVLSGIVVNIVWPGDIKGTIFSKGKIEVFEDKVDKPEVDIVDTVKRCKDCGNPIGDADVCPLCGARN